MFIVFFNDYIKNQDSLNPFLLVELFEPFYKDQEPIDLNYMAQCSRLNINYKDQESKKLIGAFIQKASRIQKESRKGEVNADFKRLINELAQKKQGALSTDLTIKEKNQEVVVKLSQKFKEYLNDALEKNNRLTPEDKNKFQAIIKNCLEKVEADGSLLNIELEGVLDTDKNRLLMVLLHAENEAMNQEEIMGKLKGIVTQKPINLSLGRIQDGLLNSNNNYILRRSQHALENRERVYSNNNNNQEAGLILFSSAEYQRNNKIMSSCFSLVEKVQILQFFDECGDELALHQLLNSLSINNQREEQKFFNYLSHPEQAGQFKKTSVYSQTKEKTEIFLRSDLTKETVESFVAPLSQAFKSVIFNCYIFQAQHSGSKGLMLRFSEIFYEKLIFSVLGALGNLNEIEKNIKDYCEIISYLKRLGRGLVTREELDKLIEPQQKTFALAGIAKIPQQIFEAELKIKNLKSVTPIIKRKLEFFDEKYMFALQSFRNSVQHRVGKTRELARVLLEEEGLDLIREVCRIAKELALLYGQEVSSLTFFQKNLQEIEEDFNTLLNLEREGEQLKNLLNSSAPNRERSAGVSENRMTVVTVSNYDINIINNNNNNIVTLFGNSVSFSYSHNNNNRVNQDNSNQSLKEPEARGPGFN